MAFVATAVVRRALVRSATAPFGHADYPLAHSLDHPGDPGLFGPGSVTWEVVGDVSAFVGGIRALLIQAAHPEVVAGVADHSRYREDPLGRLSRTSAYVTATAYGALPEVEAAVEAVRRAHRGVRGRSHRDEPYSADTPALASWVHNALADSFLQAYRMFGPRHLSPAEADDFVKEQTRLGGMLAADDLPTSAARLSGWIAEHPAIGPSPGMSEAVRFLLDPPLSRGQRIGYGILFRGAAATLPPRLRKILGVRRLPGAIVVCRLGTRLLRWALGASPSWRLALVRNGLALPAGLFRQPLPVVGAGATGRSLEG